MNQVVSGLADRIDAVTGPKMLKFGAWPTGGWAVTTSPEAVSALCAMWNNRHQIAAALRALDAAPQATP